MLFFSLPLGALVLTLGIAEAAHVVDTSRALLSAVDTSGRRLAVEVAPLAPR